MTFVRAILFFFVFRTFNSCYGSERQHKSPCQILWPSIKQLLRYCKLSIYFKMAIAHHHRFAIRVLGPSSTSTLWSLSLCKIWFESISSFDNMQVLIFCEFGSKMYVPYPFCTIFGALTQKCKNVAGRAPKGTNGCKSTSFEPLNIKSALKLSPLASMNNGIDGYVNKKCTPQRVFFLTLEQMLNRFKANLHNSPLIRYSDS